jgi:L-aminopeptidase/D-esterase-like protein
MERTTRQFTISLPPDMAEDVIAIAKAESRTISELFREAFRSYRAARIRALLSASQETGRRKRHMGHKVDDVQNLIASTRRARAGKHRR